MVYLGIDIGSLSCDAVIIDSGGRILAWTVVPTGAKNLEAIERARREVVTMVGIEPEAIAAVVSTGYGRDRVADRLSSVTEISCHARGIIALLPGTQLVVDIGGQDSKAIRLGEAGRVVDFAMNDKCAAGTGRFLEVMARVLEVDIGQLGELDSSARESLTLSSTCTVFAESEVVSAIADGAELSEIVSGIHRAIARRTVALAKRVAPNLTDLKVAMSGGVARNKGVVRALGRALEVSISVPPEPDIVGALGAALIARDKATRAS
ncbi:MAG: 2-hydroxyglutaryl-CoA dehydratase [Deltaproteobacteria bacterium]|nr:2-hydroxyglutaryl-CoA dehydratase [Deltaproteobacteria bacterium]